MSDRLDGWCVGAGTRHPHVPDGGLTVATVTPYGTEVKLCRECFRHWRAAGPEGDR